MSVEKKSIQPVVLSSEEALVWLDTSSGQWNDRLDALLPDEAELGCGLDRCARFRHIHFISYQMTYRTSSSKQVDKRITTSRSNSPSMLNADVDKKEGIKALIDRLPPEPRTPTRMLGTFTLRPSPSPASRSGPFSIAKQRSVKRKTAATSIDSDDELPPGPAPLRPAKRRKKQSAQNGEAGGAQRPSPERMDVDEAEAQHNAPTPKKGSNVRASGGKGKGRKRPSPEPNAAAAAEPQPWPPKRTRKRHAHVNDVDNVHAEGGDT